MIITCPNCNKQFKIDNATDRFEHQSCNELLVPQNSKSGQLIELV